eukprot:gene35665-46261_t
MSLVARNGNLEMLRWLKERECPKDLNTFLEAARGCHVEVLDWLQNMYGWPDAIWPDAFSTCDVIASTGRLDILQWALDHGCPWDARCACTCAREGHMEMFRWIMDLNQEFFPIDMDSLCSYAAFGGHLQLLQLAREDIWEGDLANYNKWMSGCPMNRSGCLNAANSNRWQRLMSWVACKALVLDEEE